jgi:hypothetical protein
LPLTGAEVEVLKEGATKATCEERGGDKIVASTQVRPRKEL